MVRYDFTNKIALVTGSSRGMGATILEAFAKAGAVCLLHFYADNGGNNRRDADQVAGHLRSTGAKVHLLVADVPSGSHIEAMMKRVRSEFGGLDILVNNAGVIRDRTVKKMSLEEWNTVLDTNLDGVFFCSKHGAEILRENGRIVNIASISGVVGFHGQANYAAAKAGVIALTKVLSK